MALNTLNLLLAILLLTSGKSSDVPGEISISIIAEGSPKDTLRHHKMGSEHAKQFLARVFSETFPNPIASRTMWPPVFTGLCPEVQWIDATSYEKVHTSGYTRGLLMAHRQIWEEFVKVHKAIPSNTPTFEIPKLIVFEDDAMETDPAAPDMAYQSVRNMTSDLHYLGHCYDRHPGVEPPECLHSYALTLKGARIILENFDWCANENGGAIDGQMKHFAMAGVISWSSVPAHEPYGISDAYIQKKALADGFTIQWGNAAGGLFYQVLFDDIIIPVDKGVYKVKWPQKSVFLYQNETYHEFPDVHTFASMGYDFDEVVIIPHWQLLKSMGDAVPTMLKADEPHHFLRR